MKTNHLDLQNTPIKKLFIMIAIPSIISQISSACFNLADRAFIGRIPMIGQDALTSIGLCLPIIMLITAFASLIALGGAPRVSILLGKQQKQEAEKILGNCFSGLLITSFLLMFIFYVFQSPILQLLGAKGQSLLYAKEYLSIYLLATFPIQVTVGLNIFIISQGFPKIGMISILIASITNIILDPILIFQANLGIKGAAFATLISQSIAAIWVIHFLYSSKSFVRLKFKNFKLKKEIILPCIALGFAPFIMQSTESLIIMSFNSSLLKYGGTLAVSAFTILSSLLQFTLMPTSGFAQGAQPIISYSYGSNNKQRLKQAFLISFRCCLSYSFILWIFLMIKPLSFVQFFTPDPQLQELTSYYLRIYLFGYGIFGAQIACQQALVALGNAKISAFLAMFRKLILLLPFIFLLPNLFENKTYAVFLAEPCADIIAVLTTVTIFYITFKKLLQSNEMKE